MGEMLRRLVSWITSPNWGSLGEWAAALATLAAVRVALGRGRPDITVTCSVRVWDGASSPGSPSFWGSDTVRTEHDRVYLVAANTGTLPVTVTSMGVRVPRRSYGVTPVIEPKPLSPGQELSVELSVLVYPQMIGFSPWGKCLAIDSGGHTYYAKMRWIDAVKRRWWWAYGDLSRSGRKGKGAR